MRGTIRYLRALPGTLAEIPGFLGTYPTRGCRKVVLMGQYNYTMASRGGFEQRGVISDVAEYLLKGMLDDLNAQGAEMWRPMAIVLSGGRGEAFDLHGNPFKTQDIDYEALWRRDAVVWEVDADLLLGNWSELTEREGVNIDERESDQWQVVGYSRIGNSATPDDSTMAAAIHESVTVFARPVEPA